MPEGDVRIGSLDTHIPRKSFPFVLAGGAILFFLLSRKNAAPTGGSSGSADAAIAAAQQSSDQTAIELQQQTAQAQYQLASLAASTALEQQQLNQGYQVAAGLNPGLQTQCIPINTWYNLDKSITGNLVQQVRDGQLYMNIGANGVCFSPTQMGIQGHPPIVRNSQGLFSSSVSGYATTAGPAPPPAIGTILQNLYPYVYGY